MQLLRTYRKTGASAWRLIIGALSALALVGAFRPLPAQVVYQVRVFYYDRINREWQPLTSHPVYFIINNHMHRGEELLPAGTFRVSVPQAERGDWWWAYVGPYRNQYFYHGNWAAGIPDNSIPVRVPASVVGANLSRARRTAEIYVSEIKW